jgi:hypothetical protein
VLNGPAPGRRRPLHRWPRRRPARLTEQTPS